ncbi:MAG: hypothetical protein D6760_12390 [Deltaproteobacteria bacterium]|nr:MAG: hypothetical protein D6760_12390 [Deltaproteobacteria bacterium]
MTRCCMTCSVAGGRFREHDSLQRSWATFGGAALPALRRWRSGEVCEIGRGRTDFGRRRAAAL